MLEELFTSKVRVEMLKLFIRDPEDEYYVREITRAVETEINAVRRELENFENLGLVEKWERGNRLYYKVRTSHPLYDPLLMLISHEFGLGGIIIKHKNKLGNIRYAFMAKALPKGRVAEEKDVDLVLVGDINTEVLKQYIRAVEKEHKHEINYMVLSETEFKALKARKDAFFQRILVQPRVMLLGDEDKMIS